MKNLHSLNQYRLTSPSVVALLGGIGDHETGVFQVPSPIDGQVLLVIVSCDLGWEHVSVSRRKRTPNWPEMDFVKRLFFKDDETVMQLHVPPTEHINCHPNCLHLWRPVGATIPRPPMALVGGGASPEVAERLRPVLIERAARHATGRL